MGLFSEVRLYDRPFNEKSDKGLEFLAETGNVFGRSKKDVKNKISTLAISRGAIAVYDLQIKEAGFGSYVGTGKAYRKIPDDHNLKPAA